MLCRILSFAGRSTTRLWIRISNRSNVAVPSPHGDFLVQTLNRFVGNGIGPLIGRPAPLAIVFIRSITLFSLSISTLCNLILTLFMGGKQKLDF